MTTLTPNLAFIGGGIGWQEIALLALLGVLIFGKRLPEVGKSLGRGIVEFKKGLAGVDEDIEDKKKQQDTKRLEAQAQPAVDTGPAPNTATADAPDQDPNQRQA